MLSIQAGQGQLKLRKAHTVGLNITIYREIFGKILFKTDLIHKVKITHKKKHKRFFKPGPHVQDKDAMDCIDFQ